MLTDAKSGQIASEQAAIINKPADGQVNYQTNENTPTETVYNTMTTPRGGQYALTLSDGTKVILNAASSIKYPTAFTSDERIVELNGEAYFEVAHNKTKLFKVKTTNETVEVLGTHFNVNAYSDEPNTKTTLLEGSVRINTETAQKTIAPGQQAVLSKDQIKVSEVDVEEVTAWKNGSFQFSDEKLEGVMRKISRWYDVDIVYANEEIKQLPCNAISTRFSNVSKVLRMMELSKKVHFKVEGKKIIVSN